MTSDQQIVLNSGEATQQVIVDQSQMSFVPGQTFVKQETELVEYQTRADLPQSSGQQQVFYAAASNIKPQTIEVFFILF